MSDHEKRPGKKRGKSGKGGGADNGDGAENKGQTPKKFDEKAKNYEVGYKKPPLHSRFPPGKSGNAKGKPVKKLNVNTIAQKVFFAPIPIQQNGKTTSVPAIEAIMLKMRNNALAGDFRSAMHAIQIAVRVENPDSPDGQAESLPLDPKMLAALMRDYLDHNIETPDERAANGSDGTNEEEG